MLARQDRLSRRQDVARVYRTGRTARSGPLAIKWAANQLGRPRATIVVSKKVAAKAPVRNRIRRRLYAALRQESKYWAASADMIISVFSDEVAVMAPAKLKSQLAGLLDKLHPNQG